jgi:hypothetical protein
MFWLRLYKLAKIIRNPQFLPALIEGVAAGIEHTGVLQGMNLDFIVDVGANRGQFALISRKCFPQAEIHSFEPLEEPTRVFNRIFAGDPRIILHRCAIGPEKMTSTLHVTQEDDSSSLLPITNPDDFVSQPSNGDAAGARSPCPPPWASHPPASPVED